MKYFSMFSGIGGFELGIERTITKCEGGRKRKPRLETQMGYCIGFSEIDKYAIETYKKHFPHHKAYGDAKKINPEELQDFDMLCGGFPCQSFSIAGKRKGFQDTRGTLFHEICRIVAVKKPRLLLLENVKGLLSADNGRCFATILTSLDELGYSCEWQVLNSKHFGVPQNRERVFIIGHLRGKSSRQVFPIKSHGKENNGTGTIIRTLTWGGHSGGLHSQMTGIKEITGNRQGYRCYDVDGISNTLNANAGGLTKDNCIAVLTPTRSEKRQNGRRFKENGEEMFTLTGQDIHGVMVSPCLHGFKHGTHKHFNEILPKTTGDIRRLTPVECERLQGFPDGWTEGISDTQRYKQLGNAVTVNVIEAIMGKINTLFQNKKNEVSKDGS